MKKLICLTIIPIMLVLATACGHEHTFADATCTEPKTCTECGETEGEALGHTVGIGYCSRCVALVEKEDMVSINNHFKSMLKNLENSTDYIRLCNESYSASDRFSYSKKAADYLKKHQDELSQIARIASKYDELKSLYKYAQTAIGHTIIVPSSGDTSELLDFYDSAEEYILDYCKASDEWEAWCDDLRDKAGISAIN
ncbi:MAG: hypothetical protein ACI4JI_07270 [Ruminiclostridium sp.]